MNNTIHNTANEKTVKKYTSDGEVIIVPKPYNSVTTEEIKRKRIKVENGEDKVEEYNVHNTGTMCHIEENVRNMKVVRVSDKAIQTDNIDWTTMNFSSVPQSPNTWPVLDNGEPLPAHAPSTWPILNNQQSFSSNLANTWPIVTNAQSSSANPSRTWPLLNNSFIPMNPNNAWTAMNNNNQLTTPNYSNIRGTYRRGGGASRRRFYNNNYPRTYQP